MPGLHRYEGQDNPGQVPLQSSCFIGEKITEHKQGGRKARAREDHKEIRKLWGASWRNPGLLNGKEPSHLRGELSSVRTADLGKPFNTRLQP